MTLQTFNFNAGAQGAAIAASGNLSAIGTVPANMTYDSAYASEGLRGLKVVHAASASSYLEVLLGATTNSMSATFYMRADAQLSGQGRGFFTILAGAVAYPLGLAWSSTNQILWTDGVGAQAYITPSAGAMVANQWYRFSVVATTTGSTGATGSLTVKIYLGDSLTPAYTYTSSTFNFGAGSFDRIELGGTASDRTASWTVGYDFLNTNGGSTTEIGPPGNNPPTATITGNQNVAAGASVTATMTATDTDGTIASYAWTVLGSLSTATPALTGASTATVSLTAPAAGNVVTLQCVATDNGGATVTQTTEVRVPITGSTAAVPIPGPGTVGGAYNLIGGAADEGTALNDSNPATLVESLDLTSIAQVRIFRLQPMNSRSSFQVALSGAVLTAAATHTSSMRVYQGHGAAAAIQIASASLAAVNTTASNPSYTLTAGELAGITDWGDVRVGLVPVI